MCVGKDAVLEVKTLIHPQTGMLLNLRGEPKERNAISYTTRDNSWRFTKWTHTLPVGL